MGCSCGKQKSTPTNVRNDLWNQEKRQLNIIEKALRNCKCKYQLSPGMYMLIIENMQTHEFQEGEMIFKAGDQADHLYVMETGKIKITQKQRQNVYLKSCQVFGDLNVDYDKVTCFDKIQTRTAIALEKCKIHKISRNQLMAIMGRDKIDDLPLFVRMCSSDLLEVKSQALIRVYKNGDIIGEKGKPIEGLYIIQEGHVLVRDEDSMLQLRQRLVSGDFFGDRNVQLDYKSNLLAFQWDYVADSPCVVMVCIPMGVAYDKCFGVTLEAKKMEKTIA